ncbi:hypothetical protein MHBO_003188, partial [Bonamia ostreae]
NGQNKKIDKNLNENDENFNKNGQNKKIDKNLNGNYENFNKNGENGQNKKIDKNLNENVENFNKNGQNKKNDKNLNENDENFNKNGENGQNKKIDKNLNENDENSKKLNINKNLYISVDTDNLGEDLDISGSTVETIITELKILIDEKSTEQSCFHCYGQIHSVVSIGLLKNIDEIEDDCGILKFILENGRKTNGRYKSKITRILNTLRIDLLSFQRFLLSLKANHKINLKWERKTMFIKFDFGLKIKIGQMAKLIKRKLDDFENRQLMKKIIFGQSLKLIALRNFSNNEDHRFLLFFIVTKFCFFFITNLDFRY